MSHAFYNFLHLFGIFLVLISMGGIAVHIINGGTRNFASRKFLAITHGIGMLILFVAGFGLMARIGLAGQGSWPPWIFLKLLIWVIVGALPMLMYRKLSLGKIWLLAILSLVSTAAWIGINKPFA